MKMTEEIRNEITALQRAEKNGAVSKELRKELAQDICKKNDLHYYEIGDGWLISELELPMLS